MSRNDASGVPEPRNQGGGGIAFGGGSRSTPRPATTAPEIAAALRRRWASGIAIVTALDMEGGLRGMTVTSLMVVAEDPPVIAVALTASGSFQHFAGSGAVLGVSVLDATHDFASERFAGRAPLPDARFTGVRHHIEDGLPILDGALGWCVGRVRQQEEVGDHILVLLDITRGEIGPDTDDPLLSYEGRYRRLEAG